MGQIIDVVLPHIIDTEVINNERKNDVFGGVFPKRGDARDGGISKLGEMQMELVILNATGLFQAWYSFADFHVNPDVGGQGGKTILADDFIGGNIQGNFHVFVPGHWSFIIKVFNVQGQ